MLSTLPKLLDRNFAIGYVFPCLLFVYSAYQIIRRLSHLSWLSQLAVSDITTRTTTFVTVAFAIAVVLALANTFLIRRCEGYGWPFTKLRFLYERQRQKYRSTMSILEDYEENWDHILSLGGVELSNARRKRDELLRCLVLYFPDSEAAILPTSLGNIIRAFEVYPRIMYGLDSIPGWPRLIAVVPEKYLRFSLDAKAKLDFCVNLLVLSLGLSVIILASLCAPRHTLLLTFIFFLDGLLIVGVWHMTKHAAMSWGNFVKSCFDLYIDDLAVQLGYSAPLTKETWTNISQAFIYPDESPAKPRRSQLSKR